MLLSGRASQKLYRSFTEALQKLYRSFTEASQKLHRNEMCSKENMFCTWRK
jgi:hypothetical protein